MSQKIELLPVATLMSDPANLRKHDGRNIAAIKASLVEFGQVTPIVVDAKGIVRKGNGTLAAARELGWQTIQAVRTKLEGSRATAYAIADNRTTDLSAFADVELAETLRALQGEDFNLDAVGFSEAEIDALCKKLGDEIIADGPGPWKGMNEGQVVDDPANEWQGMPEFQNQDQMPHRTLRVHFRDDDDVSQFANLIGQRITENVKWIWHPELQPVPFEKMRYVEEP